MGHKFKAAIFLTLSLWQYSVFAENCTNSFQLPLKGQTTIVFCEIPAARGVFIGSEIGKSDEMPVIARDFSKFQMAQFEVTQLQYKAVMGLEPWKENGEIRGTNVKEGDQNPAVFVSYYDALAFAKALSTIDQSATYRLPTEAEFEYATRAGTKTRYYWGEVFDAGYLYFYDNTESGQYARSVESCPDAIRNQISPGYCANAFGLYHMLGNVWEWVEDAYEDSYRNANTNGNVAQEGNAQALRVIRGQCWLNREKGISHSRRGQWNPAEGDPGCLGFRVVRVAKPIPGQERKFRL